MADSVGQPDVDTAVVDTQTARQPDIQTCKFNSTGSSILATTQSGFLIYGLDRDGSVSLQHEYDVGTDIKFAERLYSTNLVAYCTYKNPDVFVVFHCKRRKIVCDFRYPSEITIIRFNRQRVIIAVKDVIYIHNVRNMQILHLIKDVAENPRNMMELACSESCGYVAFPWKAGTGAVRIFDVFQLQDISCIPAHQSPLALARFDPTGTRIATSSVKGTCIRVFDSSHGHKLYEFRRGFKEVKIASLSFSLDGRYLSATSDSETIHIFKLNPAAEAASPSAEGSGFLRSVKTVSGSPGGSPGGSLGGSLGGSPGGSPGGSLGGLLNSEERACITMANQLHRQNSCAFMGSLAGSVNLLLTTPTGLLNVYVLVERANGNASLSPVNHVSLREAKKPGFDVFTADKERNSGDDKKTFSADFDKLFQTRAHAEIKESVKSEAQPKRTKNVSPAKKTGNK